MTFLFLSLPGIIYGDVYINPEGGNRITVVFFLNKIPSSSKRYLVQLWKMDSAETMINSEMYKFKDGRFPESGIENGVKRAYVDVPIIMEDDEDSTGGLNSKDDKGLFGPTVPYGFKLNINEYGVYELRFFEVDVISDMPDVSLGKVKLIKSAMSPSFSSGFLISNTEK